jgi:hypothetical protein
MGDLCRQVSWLTARAPHPTFPAHRYRVGQWHSWTGLAVYSCGGSRGISGVTREPRSLFTRPLITDRNQHTLKQSDGLLTVKARQAGKTADGFIGPEPMQFRNARLGVHRRASHAEHSASHGGEVDQDRLTPDGIKIARPQHQQGDAGTDERCSQR